MVNDTTTLRVRLGNGRYINTDDEGARAIEDYMSEQINTISSKESEINDIKERQKIQNAKIEELENSLRGEEEGISRLQVSDEVLENAINTMMEERGEAESIANACGASEKVMNSILKLRGAALHKATSTEVQNQTNVNAYITPDLLQLAIAKAGITGGLTVVTVTSDIVVEKTSFIILEIILKLLI